MELKRLRVIRPEVRLAPCKGIGGAGPLPGVLGWRGWSGACRPGSACEYHVEREER